MWIRIFVCFRPFKGRLGLFNAYLVVFVIFLPKKEEEKNLLYIIKKKYIIKIGNLDKGGRGGGSANLGSI